MRNRRTRFLIKVPKVRKVSWVPLTIFWIYHKLVFAIKYWKSTRYAVKDLIFNFGCKIIWKIIICLEFLEAEIWLRGGLNVFWMQHPLVKISILLNGKYWSERSASAALRCCSVHYFWDYFFFLSFFSVPHTFLPEGVVLWLWNLQGVLSHTKNNYWGEKKNSGPPVAPWGVLF